MSYEVWRLIFLVSSDVVVIAMVFALLAYLLHAALQVARMEHEQIMRKYDRHG